MKQERNNLTCAGIALLCVAVIAVLIGMRFDYYLDLNDDVFIRAITSGAYTGTPEAHNIQMLYPIGFVLSLLYRIAGGVEWYALFLTAAQYLCVGIILYESLQYLQLTAPMHKARRIVTFVIILALLMTLLITHLVMLQYTMTCAILSGTAAFLFMTTHRKSGFITGVVLILIAFAVRSEMLLLTLPMTVLPLCYRMLLSHDAKETTEKQTPLKFLMIIAAVLALGIAALFGWHNAAYGSAEWKEFNRLFDNRTELYDFHAIPAYPEDATFFETHDMEEAEAYLLTNYNYGLSEKVDADLLGEVAAYAADKEAADGADNGRFLKALSGYAYRIKHVAFPESYAYPQTDAPWNLLAIILYLGVFLLYMMPEAPEEDEDGYVALISVSRFKAIFPELLLLFVIRTGLWMYLLYRGRDPVRVTHGLYFVEIMILFGFLLRRIHIFLGIEVAEATMAKMPKTERKRGPDGKKLPVSYDDIVKQKRWNWDSVSKVKSFRMAMAFLLIMITISFLSMGIVLTGTETAERDRINAPFNELFTSIKADKEHVYLMDVYSIVPYSEKAFAKDTQRFANYDLMGGWMCKSPAQNDKALHAAEAYGSYPLKEDGTPLSMAKALLTEDVYYVAAETSLSTEQGDADNTQWLKDFAASQGVNITVEEVETIADTFHVYQVSAQN